MPNRSDHERWLDAVAYFTLSPIGHLVVQDKLADNYGGSSITSICYLTDTTIAIGHDKGSISFVDIGDVGQAEEVGIEEGGVEGGGEGEGDRTRGPGSAIHQTGLIRFAHDAAVHCLCALKDGRLVSGSRSSERDMGVIRIWRRPHLQSTSRWAEGVVCEREICIHDASVYALVELEGGLMASGSQDKTIKIWRIDEDGGGDGDKVGSESRDGEDQHDQGEGGTSTSVVRCLTGHKAWVYCLADLHDGRLASGAFDQSIRLWSIASGQCLQVLRIDGAVMSLVSCGGGRLVSISATQSAVDVWDIVRNKRRRLASSIFNTGALLALPSGRLIVGGGHKTRGVLEEWA